MHLKALVEQFFFVKVGSRGSRPMMCLVLMLVLLVRHPQIQVNIYIIIKDYLMNKSTLNFEVVPEMMVV
jgi:hypothetical protein